MISIDTVTLVVVCVIGIGLLSAAGQLTLAGWFSGPRRGRH